MSKRKGRFSGRVTSFRVFYFGLFSGRIPAGCLFSRLTEIITDLMYVLITRPNILFKKGRIHLDLLSIPQSGGKIVKTFWWDHRLQIRNLFMAFTRK